MTMHEVEEFITARRKAGRAKDFLVSTNVIES